MSETQLLDDQAREQAAVDTKPAQRAFHRPIHEENGIHGDTIPDLSDEDAALESFEGLENLIPNYKAASIDTIQKSLDMELSPFNAKEGNEHKLYINKEGTKLVKIDKVPVDDYFRQGREGVHKTLREIWPDHFPAMYESPSIPDETGGKATTAIVVEPLQKHPQYDEALAAAQQGDHTMLDGINKHPFTEVIDACEKAQLPFDFDSSKPENYIITPDGNQHLIDDALITVEEMVQAKDKIYAYMQERGDSVDRLTRVTAYMKGLEQLLANKESEEAMKKSNDKTTQRYGRSMSQSSPNSR